MSAEKADSSTSNLLPIVNTNTDENEEPWYKDGLRFKCTGCGQCCTGSPGYVWVTADEIVDMAHYLGLSVDEFSAKYVRVVHNRYSLREDPKTYSCLFLKENKCTVYEYRPKQCKTYPWWTSNLTSKEAWQEASKWCEGIEHSEASVVSLEVIQQSF